MSDAVMKWLPIVTSGLAFLVSLVALSYSARSFGINKRKEQREQPSISVHYDRARRTSRSGKQIFEFSVSLSDMAATANSVRSAELRIVCQRDNVNLPIVLGSVKSDVARESDGLTLPVSIAAGQTISGIICFELDENIIRGSKLASYQVTFQPTHGAAPTFEPILVLADLASDFRTS